MGSPRKSSARDSTSPKLARFFSSSAKRQGSSSDSKKSSNTGAASGSTQNTAKRWSPRKRIGQYAGACRTTESLPLEDVSFSRQPSSSMFTSLPQRHRSIATDVSPHFSHNSFEVESHKENDEDEFNTSSPSQQNRNHVAVFGVTPPSGYKILPIDLPNPSLKPRNALSRIRSPKSSWSSNTAPHIIKSNVITDELPLTMETTSVNGTNKLKVPNIDNDCNESLDSGILGTRKSKLQKFSESNERNTERRVNWKPRARPDFLYLGKFRNSPTRWSRSFDPAYVEEPSSPLLLQSLSNQILSPELGSDRSETIVFSKEDGGSLDYDDDEDCEVKLDQQLIHVSSIRSTSERDGFVQIMKRDRSASELHSLCGCMTTIDDVLRARSLLVGKSRESVARRDYKGETPMHAFSNNKTLAINLNANSEFETRDFLVLYHQPTFDQESSGKLHEITEKFLLDELLPSFPGAMMVQDNNGHIPFEGGLRDWIDTSRKANVGANTYDEYYSAYFTSYTNAVSDVVSSAWKSTSTTFLTAMSKRTESERQKDGGRDIEIGESRDIHHASSKDELTVDDVRVEISNKTKLSPHARFCIEMLSLIIDHLEKITDRPSELGHSLEGYENGRMCQGIKQLQDIYGPLNLAAQVVEHIACIPNILQTIFFISDEIDMEHTLSTTIIRRVLMNKHSVGPWLTAMLQKPHRNVSRRAMDYLQIVSKLHTSEEKDGKRSRNTISCDDVIDEVSRLRDFVPSLLSLGENGIEEVSTTKVVNSVLDKMISKPFVATVVLCDAIFLALMIIGFRFAVNAMIMGDPLDTVLSWIYVANTGIFYYIIGEIGKIVSLFLLNSHSRKYFLSFWNLIDVMAVVLAISSSVFMRWQFAIHDGGLGDTSRLRGLLAVTTGVLWLRVLSFLKSINIQLATFILAIITITKDILFFCVILITLIVSFSQMFYTLLAPSSCASDGGQMQCRQTEYLLQVYIMMLGDFGNTEREAFKTGFSVFLLVLYSFLVTVIMLNVLIAIASDSYEKCLLNSRKLFGRARVMLIAELVSFQSLLCKRDLQGDTKEEKEPIENGIYSYWWTSGSWSWTHKWSRGSILFFGLSMFVTIVWTVAELVGFAKGDKYVSVVRSLSSVFINIALYITIILFLDRNSQSEKSERHGKEWTNSLQRLVLRVLGASKHGKSDQMRKRRKGNEEWHGRVQFLQCEMDRIAERQTDLVNEQSDNFQQIMKQSEKRMRSQMHALEERSRETNHSIMSAVHELKSLISLADSSAPSRGSPVPNEVDVNVMRNMLD